MSLKLMYITNNSKIATIAENSGVDWIFIDLEINGKIMRQGHLDTVISKHAIEDVYKVSNVLTKAKLLVRVNPIYKSTKSEINKVITSGADIVMLPYFKTKKEVEMFLGYVDDRAKTCLLCETPEAVDNIDDILTLEGIDYIHIGLNDLHLGYKKKFMFELLVDGTVEKLCNRFKNRRIEYGFGGIARLGKGELPAENIICEHYRLGSSMAILSRSFCNTNNVGDIKGVENVFQTGVEKIREFENLLKSKDKVFFENNYITLEEKIKRITESREVI